VAEVVGAVALGLVVGCSGAVAEGVGTGSAVALGVLDGVGVTVADGNADEGAADGVASCDGVAGCGSVTWLTVVPLPPDRALPVASSMPVRTTAARANAANAATRTVRQDTRADAVAAAGWGALG
jgi:hypothetical protein